MPSSKNTASEPKKSGKLKIILLILLLLLILIGAALGFWWFQLREPGVSAPPPQTQTQSAAEEAVQPSSGGAASGQTVTDMPRPATNVVALPTLTVNLSDAAGDRYLRIGMEVEVSTPEAVQEIKAQSARIRDALIILLSSKTYAELAPAEGKMQLKNEVASRLNQILGTPRVMRIYFTEFMVQ